MMEKLNDGLGKIVTDIRKSGIDNPKLELHKAIVNAKREVVDYFLGEGEVDGCCKRTIDCDYELVRDIYSSIEITGPINKILTKHDLLLVQSPESIDMMVTEIIHVPTGQSILCKSVIIYFVKKGDSPYGPHLASWDNARERALCTLFGLE